MVVVPRGKDGRSWRSQPPRRPEDLEDAEEPPCRTKCRTRCLNPTGPNAVGRVSYDWLDQDRAEIYSTDPDDRRELVVWVWYPAAADAGTVRAEYLPAAWAPNAQFLGLEVDGVQCPRRRERPLADGATRYPVLLMSLSGFPPLLHSSLAEELASHGYVVVGVNHTYESAVTVFSDGRVVPASPQAVAGALRAAERQPRRRVPGSGRGLHGQGKGPGVRRRPGRPARCRPRTLVASQDASISHGWARSASPSAGTPPSSGAAPIPAGRAAVNLDGALWTDVGKVGLERPALQVLAEHEEFAVSPEQAVETGMAPDVEWFVAEKAITFGGWRTVHERSRPGYTVRVAGATHLSFLDVPLLPREEGAMVTGMLAATTIGAERMWRIISDLVLAFFGKHLGEGDGRLLDGPDPAYPELTYGPA